MSEEILDVEQLEKMGDHFLQVLLKMKHNGAIDKTRAGLTALCNRLLCSNDSRYVECSLRPFAALLHLKNETMCINLMLEFLFTFKLFNPCFCENGTSCTLQMFHHCRTIIPPE
jgi:hypothetical protein